MTTQTDAVTGATGYSGKYITRRLLNMGHRVITPTGHPERYNPHGDQVQVMPFNFDDPAALTESLRGVTTLYNTYWIRFEHGGMTHPQAVANTLTLFQAAKDAGVERIVHVSITNPSADSSLSYFKGKAEMEAFLKNLGVSYAILRPAVLFGGENSEDILINNIAWLLRRFPVFGVMGDGQYKLQPIHVYDMADLAVAQGQSRENVTIDAIGPETFEFGDLVRLIKSEIGSKALIMGVPPFFALTAARFVSLFVGDVLLTRDEVIGLMDNLLLTDSPPAGDTALTEWLHERRETIGTRYGNEVARHFDRATG